VFDATVGNSSQAKNGWVFQTHFPQEQAAKAYYGLPVS
jgi:hypothetical protein